MEKAIQQLQDAAMKSNITLIRVTKKKKPRKSENDTFLKTQKLV